jgi:hypothetical protein
MPPNIIETTVPASADCGVRTFQVQTKTDLYNDGLPISAIDVSVCGLEDKSIDGEASTLMEIRDALPSNHDVGLALINLGTALLNTIGSQLCNPDD